MHRGSTLLLLSLLVATLVSTATSRFIVEKNTVKVISPEELTGEREAAIANYGIPNYGGTLTGVVVYPDTRTTGCDEFDTKFKSKSNRAVILLVDRGGMSYIYILILIFFFSCLIFCVVWIKLFFFVQYTNLLCFTLMTLRKS